MKKLKNLLKGKNPLKNTNVLIITLTIVIAVVFLLVFTLFINTDKKAEKEIAETITPPEAEVKTEVKEVQVLAPEEEIKITEERRDPFVKPPYLTKLEKENERLKKELAKKSKKIVTPKAKKPVKVEKAKEVKKPDIIQRSTQMTAVEIKQILDQKKIEVLSTELAGVRQRLDYLESQQSEIQTYETEEPEEEYTEEEYYEPYYEPYWRYSYWYWNSWYWHFGWHPWFNWTWYPYNYYRNWYDRYYSNRSYNYSTDQKVLTRIHKNQLKRKTIRRVTNYPSRTSTKNIAKVSGTDESPWGPISLLKKNSSRISKSPSRVRSSSRNSARIYSSSSRSGSKRTSIRSSSKAPSRSRSVQSTRSTSRSSSGKIKRKK